MRIFKWLKPLRFLVVLCIVNIILSFLIEPVRGSSGTMWEEYYQETELDMVFIGASFCASSFDPYIFDEKLGVKSFNMGTPLQGIGQNISALETALEDHDIETVVIGMGFFVMQEDSVEKAELTFENAKARKKGGIGSVYEGIRYMLDEEVIGTEKSVQYLFPWLYNQQEISLEFISENVAEKIESWGSKSNEETVQSKKGYRSYIGVVDYDSAWKINSYQYYNQELNPDLTAEFEKLLKLCMEKEVDVVVVQTPHPAFDVVSCYESYEKNEAFVTALCAKYGADYYNFSLAKPEIFEAKPEYFYDFEHLNENGTSVFSNSLCRFLERRVAGEELRSSFYSVEEYLTLHEDLLEEWKEEKK